MFSRQRGFSFIELMIVIAIIAVIAAIAIPNLFAARVAANENLAKKHLRSIAELQAQRGVGKFASSLGEFKETLPWVVYYPEGLPIRAGYVFEMETTSDAGHWVCYAYPVSLNNTGNQIYRIDERLVLEVLTSATVPMQITASVLKGLDWQAYQDATGK